MNKLNKELLARALVEGVDESYDGTHVSLASGNHKYDGFHTLDNNLGDNYWQYVCTKQEYLAAKAEQEEPVLEVDWSEAPEGATHHVKDTDNGSQTQFVRYSKEGLFGEAYYCIDNEGGHWSLYVEDDEVYILTEKPAQPVFTQAMSDAGELPSVGMNCQGYVLAETKKQGRSCDKWVEGVFIQKSQAPNGGICFLFKCDNGHYYTLNSVSHFKPIDTRTEKEKAIDEFIMENVEGFNYLTDDLEVMVRDAFEAGVKWVGK